jgi:hypothetical protein
MEETEAQLFKNFLNGAIGNLCENDLKGRLDVVHLGFLPEEILKNRNDWAAALRREANDFVSGSYSIIDSLKATAKILGGVDASIKHILRQNQSAKIQLGILAERAARKRDQLLERAVSRRSARQHLHMAAGAMALISGGSSSAIALGKLIPSSSLLLGISALIALASGLTTLITSIYFDESETVLLFEGAGHFLTLRGNADFERKHVNYSEAHGWESFRLLQNSYNDLSMKYDRYLQTAKLPNPSASPKTPAPAAHPPPSPDYK